MSRIDALTTSAALALPLAGLLALAPTDARADGFAPPELWVANYGHIAGGWRVDAHPRFLADVDDDGAADIVGFGDAGVYVSRSTGTAFTDAELWIRSYGRDDGWRVDRHPRLVADLSGDDRADVVAFGDLGVYASRSTGQRFQRPRLWVANFGTFAGGWRVDRHLRELADVTGDGRDDVVGFGDHGVWVSRSTGGGLRPPELWVADYAIDAGGWQIDRHPRRLVDVDDDGLADIVGFGDAGVYVSLSTGDGFLAPELRVNNYGYEAGGWRVDRHPRALADVDGDGLVDVVGFGDAGVYVSLADGDRFGEPALWVDNYGHDAGGWRVDRHPRLLADVDDDGMADVVGFGDAGVYVSRSTGSGFAPPTLEVDNYGYFAGGWRTERHPRMMADVDGDGVADIVGFGDAGVYVSLAQP